MATPPKDFDKYYYYTRSVQSTDADTEFFLKTYKELRRKKPKVFREDFCGTYELSRTWVKNDKQNMAIGLDLDPEPIAYGREVEKAEMSIDERARLKIYKKNVLSPDLPSADIIGALNFSYYIFKQRKQLKEYFENCLDSLNKDGIFILDCFGGSDAYSPNEEVTKHKGFRYYWDQASWDPVTNFAQFYIHFKLDGKRKYEKVFSYDWRVWTIPEIREILTEAGFKKTHVYWEGTTKKGEGNGVFTRTETGEDCESWIAYIAAER